MRERVLEDKVALVTGSTQGLGAGIAHRFAEEGAKVVICGRSTEKGERVAAELVERGHEAQFIQVDLSELSSLAKLVGGTLERFGRLDVLVNSAADTGRSSLASMTEELFDYQMNLNVRAPLFLAKYALPSLKEAHGVIINIGSVNAYLGLPKLLVYSSTKGALMTASRNLANALAYERVRVHCLNVGWMDTEGEREVQTQEGNPPDFVDEAGKDMPMGRLLLPKDIAEVCLLLASNRAQAFSGAVIDLEQYPVGGRAYAQKPD
jgi:NAD(P)-dependent dehydrogenase (short-subunit alcohol dehydrogenase family)